MIVETPNAIAIPWLNMMAALVVVLVMVAVVLGFTLMVRGTRRGRRNDG
jgi:hypothetical protein